ncbi:MAG: hypothetical protein ACLFN8_00080 [Candidatus Woesearchaeota archaeon]
MSKLNNAKIHFFHRLGEYLTNLSNKASTQAEELDRSAMPEFNAVAIPGLPVGAPAEAYKDLIDALPYLNTNLTPKGKYPSNESGQSFNLKISLTEMPLVIGNFAVPDKEPPLKENMFGNSKNITLKSNTHALQEISNSMDGAYLDSIKKKSLFDLEEIVFEPLFGKAMVNPLVVFSRNEGTFLYRSLNDVAKYLEHPNLVSGQPIPMYLRDFLFDISETLHEDFFKYNTLKALDLNTGIISAYKSKK